LKDTPEFPIVTLTALNVSSPPVRLTCCPISLNPLVPTEKLTVLQFDRSIKKLVCKTTARAYGPILFDKMEMVEVHRLCDDASGTPKKEIHWLGVFNNMIRVRMRNRDDCSDTFQSHLDLLDMSFPVCPDVSRPLSRSVLYFQGDYRAEEHFSDTFPGVFDVYINDSYHCCLKMITVRENTKNRSIETFIDLDTGRVVYTQSLAGKDVVSFQQILLC
jgi:hypothetical protein